MSELREQHDDLLGLLAQQEIELQVSQRHLYSLGGKAMCVKAKQETKQIANEKYGSYISYRTDELLLSGSSDDDDGEGGVDRRRADEEEGVGWDEAGVSLWQQAGCWM